MEDLTSLTELLRFSILKENIKKGDLFKAIITPLNGVVLTQDGVFVNINNQSYLLFAIKLTDETGTKKKYQLLTNPNSFNDHSIAFEINTNNFPNESGEFLATLLVCKGVDDKGQLEKMITAQKNGQKKMFEDKFTILSGVGIANLSIKEKECCSDGVMKVELQRNVNSNALNQAKWDKISKSKIPFNDIKNLANEIISGNLGADNNFIGNPIQDSAGNAVDVGSRVNRLSSLNSNTYSALRFGISEMLNRSQAGNTVGNGWQTNSLPIDDYRQIILDTIDNYYIAYGGNPNSVIELPNYELIWSYWMEQGMLVQSINMISFRFQNINPYEANSPLNRFDVAPLYPLSDLLWNYIQDEQHTLLVKRRMNEYQHEYGLNLIGNAVGNNRNVDNRSKFLESFNTLLNICALFYKDADDTTRRADGFPLLNCLREVHMLLAEGFHNAYSNLTFTSRAEMTLQQVILARPEMQEFLGAKAMVPYSEPWIGRVDTLRQMNGWGSTSMSHFYDLAVHGERLLLSIRFTSWSQIDDSDVAADWAIHFRNEIQRYIHSYRTVTGVDLSADSSDNKEMFAVQPSMLIQRRVQNEKMVSMPRRNFARQSYY